MRGSLCEAVLFAATLGSVAVPLEIKAQSPCSLCAEPSAGLVTDKMGLTAVTTVSLQCSSNPCPAARVDVQVTVSDTSKGWVRGEYDEFFKNSVTLFFYPGAATFQPLYIQGKDDHVSPDDIPYTVTLRATSADSRFQGASKIISLTNVDRTDYNECVPNVMAQVAALPKPMNKLPVLFEDGPFAQYACPDGLLPCARHYQGVARTKDGPYLVVTGTGDGASHLLVHKLPAKQGRLASWGDNMTTWENDYLANLSSYVISTDFPHAGGISTFGDFVAVPLEGPPAGTTVVFYDLLNPAQPVRLGTELQRNSPGNYYDFAGAVAVTKYGANYLVAVMSNDPAEIRFYLSDGIDIRQTQNWSNLGAWSTEQHGFPAKCLGKAEWAATIQNMSFLQQCNGPLYLAVTYNTGSTCNDGNGENRLRVYRVDVAGILAGLANSSLLEPVTKTFDCWGGSFNYCNFAAAAGLYVSPTTRDVILYGGWYDTELLFTSLGWKPFFLAAEYPFCEVGVPAGVSASQGAFANLVRVAWTGVPGAESYRVLRNGVQIGSTSAATFDDTSVPLCEKFSYTVQAVKCGHPSITSAAAEGWTAGNLPTPVLLEAGYGHSAAVNVDGTVWTWGWNGSGQLGDATNTNRNGPVRAGSLSDVAAVAAGVFHTIALKNDGTVWTWGGNADGQLGNGSTTARSTPGQVPGLSNVVAIAAGANHTLVLKCDGTVWSWGDNSEGQLGDGTTTDRSLPVLVGVLSGVTAIGTGYLHSAAIKSDGTVWTWGSNATGQLGDGGHINRSTPAVVPGLQGVTKVVCGAYFNLALLQDGTLRAWGHNFYGQLGDGSNTERPSPVAVTGLNGVIALAAGAGFSLAVRSDGTVWGWGQNVAGQLGDGTTTDRSLPGQVVGLSNVVAVAGGEDHSLARLADGRIFGWGKNAYGQVGAGPALQLTPVFITDASTLPPLGLMYPTGGEQWQSGSRQTVRWTGAGPIRIEMSADGGAAWTPVRDSTSEQDAPIDVPAGWTTARGHLRIIRIGSPASSAQTGSYLRIVSPPLYPWLTMNVDASPEVTGEFASLAIDPWGRTAIAYVDRTNGDLKLARRVGTGWGIETVDAANSSGWFPSLVFDADGDPHISYVDGTRLKVRYVRKSSGVWQSPEDVASVSCTLETSLALGSAERPYIAFQDCATTRVRVFARTTAWTQLTSVSGASPALRMVGDLPRVSYFLHSPSPTTLRFLQASGAYNAWTWSSEAVPDTDGATTNSLALDAQGNPWISFYDTDSKSLRLTKRIGGAWSVENVDTSAGNVGDWNSLALAPPASPRISYYANGLLKYAEMNGGVWAFDVVDAAGDTGQSTSLAVDGAGNRRIAYFDVQNGNLKYAISQPDTTAPAAPSLEGESGRTTAVVTWTAQGEDGQSGGAAWAYDLRISSQPIGEGNFALATPVPTGSPGFPGSVECGGVENLNSCSPYYFGLKVLDDLGNESTLSTSGQIVTDCGGFLELICG